MLKKQLFFCLSLIMLPTCVGAAQSASSEKQPSAVEQRVMAEITRLEQQHKDAERESVLDPNSLEKKIAIVRAVDELKHGIQRISQDPELPDAVTQKLKVKVREMNATVPPTACLIAFFTMNHAVEDAQKNPTSQEKKARAEQAVATCRDRLQEKMDDPTFAPELQKELREKYQSLDPQRVAAAQSSSSEKKPSVAEQKIMAELDRLEQQYKDAERESVLDSESLDKQIATIKALDTMLVGMEQLVQDPAVPANAKTQIGEIRAKMPPTACLMAVVKLDHAAEQAKQDSSKQPAVDQAVLDFTETYESHMSDAHLAPATKVQMREQYDKIQQKFARKK